LSLSFIAKNVPGLQPAVFAHADHIATPDSTAEGIVISASILWDARILLLESLGLPGTLTRLDFISIQDSIWFFRQTTPVGLAQFALWAHVRSLWWDLYLWKVLFEQIESVIWWVVEQELRRVHYFEFDINNWNYLSIAQAKISNPWGSII